MDLVERIYIAFTKIKKDPANYFEVKDTNKDGCISYKEFKYTIYDF